VSSAKHDVSSQLAQNASLQRQIGQLADARDAEQTLEKTKAQVGTVLANDVSWSRLLTDLSRTMPAGVAVTAFDGSVGTPTTGSAGPAAAAASTSGSTGVTTAASTSPGSSVAKSKTATVGTATFTAMGVDYDAVTAWIDRISKMPEFARVFVPNAALANNGNDDVVQFNSTANITGAARSDRQAKYEGSGS
jgi:Tfp pilus assembly protein PilN